MRCALCQRTLICDELGLSKKFGLDPPLCLSCAGKKFGVPERRLCEKIEEFRKSGCALFPKHES